MNLVHFFSVTLGELAEEISIEEIQGIDQNFQIIRFLFGFPNNESLHAQGKCCVFVEMITAKFYLKNNLFPIQRIS